MSFRKCAMKIGLGASLLAVGAANAAVDPAITTAISGAQADALVIVSAITLAIIIIRVSKLPRKA